MKKILFRLLILISLVSLSACSKKPVEVTGQIFVITQGRDNIKMGGVNVIVIPDKEFVEAARKTMAFIEEEVRKEAQRSMDGDYAIMFTREITKMEKDASVRIPELETLRDQFFEESGYADQLIDSVLSPVLDRSLAILLSGFTEPKTTMTDADGKFTVPVSDKVWFLARSSRSLRDETEEYIWIKSFEAPKGVLNASAVISNEDDLDSEDDLYRLFATLDGKSDNLDPFREVRVSEKVQLLVTKHRETAIAIKAKAEIEAATVFRGERAGDEKRIKITDGVSMTFCWIPPGKFTMGSPSNEEGHSDDENQVEVTLSEGFWMAKTEVTQAQWEAVMGNNPSNFKGANLPVEGVSWYDVREFLTKINEMVGNADGGKMVLPTEAQWEYAAGAWENGPYSGGTLDEVAWHSGNSSSKTHPVGTKKPNAWGLHDMHGNVWEWCADWYASKLQGGVDPQGPNSGTTRVARGGSWNSNARDCRVANRQSGVPTLTFDFIGFRVARSSVP